MINPVIKLQKEIAEHAAFAKKHNKDDFKTEETTKQMLIIPFIEILGYDRKNPAEFQAEYSPSNTPNKVKVDYFVNKCIFIEAKPFGRNIDKDIDQVANYHNNSNEVELSILSNGTKFYFFTSETKGNVMINEPFFTFDLFDYSIEDLETLVYFTKDRYNYDVLINVATENRMINKITTEVYNFLDNVESIKDVLNPVNSFSSEILSRIVAIATERAVVLKGEEYESERKQQVILKYSEDQLKSLGKYELHEELNHTVFIPCKEQFDKIVNTKAEDYSIEKGNPQSDFFIAGIYMQGRSILGYLIGQFSTPTATGEDNIQLYCVPNDGIEKFVKDNEVVKQQGFINAKFLKRENTKSGTTTYYLQSNISGVTFQNFPNLVIEITNFEDYYNKFNV